MQAQTEDVAAKTAATPPDLTWCVTGLITHQKRWQEVAALFNPETPILIQKRHPYTSNLNSETLRDSKIAFLHWGDVSETMSIINSSDSNSRCADIHNKHCHMTGQHPAGEKKRHHYAFWHRFYENPGILPGCPGPRW